MCLCPITAERFYDAGGKSTAGPTDAMDRRVGEVLPRALAPFSAETGSHDL